MPGRRMKTTARSEVEIARWRDYADEALMNPAQRDRIQAALRVEAIR